MIFNFCFAIFLFVFNCGPFVFSENRAFQKRVEDLRLKNVPEEEKENAREIAKSMYSNNTIGQVFTAKSSIKSVSTRSIYRSGQPKGTFSGGVDSISTRKQNEISAYKAKVTIRDNNTVNYNAVYNAVRADDNTKKELMR